MWETAFDLSMLNDSKVIVNCPSIDLVESFMNVLAENGVTWCGGEAPNKYNSKWNNNKEETCYWIENGTMTYENKQYAEEYADDFPNHIKCTFYGADTTDFEIANDDDIRKFLGI